MIKYVITLCCLFSFLLMDSSAFAQVTGQITDEKSEPLPFATIYIKGTSIGTTSNIEGSYELPLEKGKYELVFQYIGYEQVVKRVNYTGQPQVFNISLKEQAIALQEVVVKADAEDPAYAVIRKAIAKRKYYRDLIDEYSCDVYIKGNIKFLDAPKTFFGQDIGDLLGTLDSNRQGIIYLSESESKLYFKKPNKYKEHMLYSKVSGNDNGFSFNSASDMDFDLYDSYSNFGRQIISPIDDNALFYYKYQLMGTFFDESNRLINQIKIIPKRSEDPVYSGIIYIVEDLWNIQGVDITLSGGAMKQPGLDSLFIKQVHVPVKEPDTWRMISQSIRSKAGIFGFKLVGDFTGIYSNYNIEPKFEKGFFDNEVFKVEEKANDISIAHFDSIRPIPLTREEEVDYVKKDSLQIIRKSKPYLDSIDAKNNKFTFGNFLFGYSYNRSYERKYFSVNSPISTLQFNAVQGWNANLGLSFRRNYDTYSQRWFRLSSKANYGLSDKRLRGDISMQYNFDRIHNTRLQLEGGVVARQINPNDPITPNLNTIVSMYWKDNFMRLYEKTYGKIGFSRELVNGVYLRTSVEYAQRKPLENTTDYSFRDREIPYQDNNSILQEGIGDRTFETNNALLFEAHLRFRINQKYISYPGRKFNQGSKWPDIWIHYQKGINAFDSDVDFDHLSLQIREGYAPLGLIGYFEINAEVGTFLNKDAVSFVDFKHFNGNQTIIGNPTRYLSSFMRLPYYAYSTQNLYAQVHFQHHFEGFLLDKIPGIRKLGFSTVLGTSILYTDDQGTYSEYTFGIDKIGWSAFRFFRLDFVAAKPPNTDFEFGMMIGLNLPIN